MSEEWKSPQSRHNIVQKIDEHLRRTPILAQKTASEFENQIFSSSKTKEEYNQYLTKLICHLNNQSIQNPNQNNPHLTAMLSNQDGQGPGTPQQSQPNAQQIKGQSMMPGQPLQSGPRMGQPMINNICPQGDVNSWQVNNRRLTEMQMMNIGQKQQSQIGNMNQYGQPGKMGQMQMTVGMGQVGGQMLVGIGGQMQRQTPGMQPHILSPYGIGAGGQRQCLPTGPGASPLNQQGRAIQASPVLTTPSPVMAMSPAGSVRPMSVLGASSPGMINTPIQMQMNQQASPANMTPDERARLKLKQLEKYIEPLRAILPRQGDGDGKKHSKLKMMLDIITNHHNPPSIDIIEKCGDVLQKLLDEPVQSPKQILWDAITLAYKSPQGTHIIHKALMPGLQTLSGPEIGPLPPRHTKKEESNTEGQICYSIQGEVARLPPRFKVHLEQRQPPESDDLTLVCQLDDTNLPCVPPITVTIPSNYPDHPPYCRLSSVEYDTTVFLKRVREITLGRLCHLPHHCTLTMLLDTWEMSIRQACSSKSINDAINPFIAIRNI